MCHISPSHTRRVVLDDLGQSDSLRTFFSYLYLARGSPPYSPASDPVFLLSHLRLWPLAVGSLHLQRRAWRARADLTSVALELLFAGILTRPPPSSSFVRPSPFPFSWRPPRSSPPTLPSTSPSINSSISIPAYVRKAERDYIWCVRSPQSHPPSSAHSNKNRIAIASSPMRLSSLSMAFRGCQYLCEGLGGVLGPSIG